MWSMPHSTYTFALIEQEMKLLRTWTVTDLNSIDLQC